MPDSTLVENPFGSFSLRWEIVDHGIRLIRIEEVRATRLPPAEYALAQEGGIR